MIPNVSYVQYYVNLTQALLNNGILLIVVGGVIVLVTIIGLVGVITRNKVFLVVVSICLIPLSLLVRVRNLPHFQIHPFSTLLRPSSMALNGKHYDNTLSTSFLFSHCLVTTI